MTRLNHTMHRFCILFGLYTAAHFAVAVLIGGN